MKNKPYAPHEVSFEERQERKKISETMLRNPCKSSLEDLEAERQAQKKLKKQSGLKFQFHCYFYRSYPFLKIKIRNEKRRNVMGNKPYAPYEVSFEERQERLKIKKEPTKNPICFSLYPQDRATSPRVLKVEMIHRP